MLAAFFLFSGLLSVFQHSWTVPDPADWKVDGTGGQQVLHLLTGKEPPSSGPRRPFQFAIADTKPFQRVHIEADMKPLGKSLIIVYAYRDPAHFDYAHLSVDTATAQPHHNGIFHVYGGERVRISSEAGPPAFASTGRWHHVVFDYDGAKGTVSVAVDGKSIPALHAVDLSLSDGKIGIGSFDETGEFKSVVIR
jgi:hypothetical protein